MHYNKETEEGSRVSFRNVMCIMRRLCAGKSYCGVTLLHDGLCHCGGWRLLWLKASMTAGSRPLHPLEPYPDVCRAR
jgi:hypothetical protein